MSTVSAQTPPAVPHLPVVGYRLASDSRLARLAAAGSAGAMTAIFERHQPALHRYCWSIVGNDHDAADALQNTMIKALRALPGETREIALRPWLYRIAHNESISLLRTRRPDSDLDAASQLSDLAGADALDARERMLGLTGDLAELTERQRSALLMRELGGLEFGEVASALSTSPAAAKQSVYEARRALLALEEGRAMDCDAIRRTLSDGDGRALRAMRMRGHLRDCAGCRDFELAMRARPVQLAAVIPPLPAAVAAAILQSVLGGGGTGGGGTLAGLAGAAKVTTGLSAAAKVAAVVAVTATLGGGAVVGAPLLEHGGRDRPRPGPAPAAAAASAKRLAAGSATGVAGRLQRAGASSATTGLDPVRAGGQASGPGAGAASGAASTAPAGGASSHGAAGAKGKSATAPGHAGTAHKASGKGAGNSAAGDRGKSAASSHGKSAASAHRRSAAKTTGRPATPPATANAVATSKQPGSPAEVDTAKTQQAAGGPGAPPAARRPATTPAQVPADATAPGTAGTPHAAGDRP
jgi:RNA polymerase sigma factor (sigma-70 family)